MKTLFATTLVLLSCGSSFAATPVVASATVAPSPVTSASLIEKLKTNGFICKPEVDGTICVVPKVNAPKFQYSQPVAIVIPSGVTNPTTTQLYMHGFKGVCESADSSAEFMVNEFGFLRQLHGQNSIMVYPMSSGKCANYNQQLVPQFSGFLTWLSKQIPITKHWVIAGHSGAGRPIGYILAQNPSFTKHVDSAILLDAAYGMPSHIGEWRTAVNTNSNMDITSVYTGGGSTAQGSHLLKSSLSVPVFAGPASTQRHCLVPTNDYGHLLSKSLARHAGK